MATVQAEDCVLTGKRWVWTEEMTSVQRGGSESGIDSEQEGRTRVSPDGW